MCVGASTPKREKLEGDDDDSKPKDARFTDVAKSAGFNGIVIMTPFHYHTTIVVTFFSIPSTANTVFFGHAPYKFIGSPGLSTRDQRRHVELETETRPTGSVTNVCNQYTYTVRIFGFFYVLIIRTRRSVCARTSKPDIYFVRFYVSRTDRTCSYSRP